MINGSTPIMLL